MIEKPNLHEEKEIALKDEDDNEHDCTGNDVSFFSNTENFNFNFYHIHVDEIKEDDLNPSYSHIIDQ